MPNLITAAQLSAELDQWMQAHNLSRVGTAELDAFLEEAAFGQEGAYLVPGTSVSAL